MTGVAVISGAHAVHLVADTVASSDLMTPKPVHERKPIYLSTGVYLDEIDLQRVIISDDCLKIGIIGGNIGVGFSGRVDKCNEVLRLLNECSKESAFQSIGDLENKLRKSIIPSVNPRGGNVFLCGFFLSRDEIIKFKLESDHNGRIEFNKTSDHGVNYFIGTGADLLERSWNSIPNLEGAKGREVTAEYSCLVNGFYARELSGDKEHILFNKTGGIITGLFSMGKTIEWQGSKTIIMVENIGGIGSNAECAWNQTILKTWYEEGNVFSMSAYYEGNEYNLNIKAYGNSLTPSTKINKNNLLPEMKTFKSDMFSIILRQQDNGDQHYAIRDVHTINEFIDERIENNRISNVRLHLDALNNSLEDTVFFTGKNILVGQVVIFHIIKSMSNEIDRASKEGDISKLIYLQTNLGDKIVKLARLSMQSEHIKHKVGLILYRNDFEYILSVSLKYFLTAWMNARAYSLHVEYSESYIKLLLNEFPNILEEGINEEDLGEAKILDSEIYKHDSDHYETLNNYSKYLREVLQEEHKAETFRQRALNLLN